MDTYASSAGDPDGFYDVPAIAPAVDGFFVMAYQLNLDATPQATSPLTSSDFSDLSTVQQYAAAVPPSKVILGTPYYGEDWPTTDGTLTAQATGGETAAHLRPGDGQWSPDIPGPCDRHGVDGVPGWITVARDVLRGPDLALPAGPAGAVLWARRPRDLGAGHGRQRPVHAGRSRRVRPRDQGAAEWPRCQPGAIELGPDHRPYGAQRPTADTFGHFPAGHAKPAWPRGPRRARRPPPRRRPLRTAVRHRRAAPRPRAETPPARRRPRAAPRPRRLPSRTSGSGTNRLPSRPPTHLLSRCR